ncbi:MAG: histidine--tRNA ligase [Desulfobacteraceae bacterium]|nr:histidine--tRNA ligase [Desulfobacteraceae bacterium]MCB9494765.1 histidine--tRNA ligase [Desulfobacteraceae bacterium]
MIQTIRGFRDILPDEIQVWQRIEQEAKNIFENYGFKEIRLPILEKTEVFARGIGENTDIVEKEMFTFPDSKGKNQTMRPEATASIVRSYIQHKMYARDPEQKLYTIGPMFRKERPQKGRYRQFYQINAEVLGIDSPILDAQILVMLNLLFKRLEVKNLSTKINSLGCPLCRKTYNEALLSFIGNTENLCEDCERRKTKNPLRILDCKVESCRNQLEGAPLLKDYLCDECKIHFETLKNCLELENISYEIDDYLVRGLDYYTKTAFEIQTRELGAQSAVAGGGRYDGLIEILGGPKTPGIGFAIGFDRLVEIIAAKNGENNNIGPIVYFLAFGKKASEKAFKLCNELASKNIRAEMDFSDKSMKASMKKANKSNCRFCAIIGETEVEKGIISLKNMELGSQEEILEKDFISTMEKNI